MMGDESLPPPLPCDHAINLALVRRVDEYGLSPGMVVGIVDGDERKFFAYGRAGPSIEQVDEHTVFEIGSVTKLFTILLLADMAKRGEVSLDTPVAELLPGGTRVPERGGVAITLTHLATHTSGLPRLPDDIPALSPDPYADYTAERL
ncbi:MAG: beta-lactamase family protein, partial [Acetobacteraceae bacterium]|nr:beta-lactamase family protein [Acetobacteraceae bacterium]